MTNAYLLDVIKALQPAERQEISLLLASPNFNKGGNAKELTHLYQTILDAAPEFSDVLLNKERVYAQVFSDQNMVLGKLEKLMADLNKLLRTYILTQQYFSESNEEAQQIDLAAWLRERGLAERSRQILTRVKAQKGRKKAESLALHRTNLLIAEEEHEWESMYNQAKGDLSIPKLICHLDLHYQIYRIELINRYILQRKVAQLKDLEKAVLEGDFYQGESILLQISTGINDLLSKPLPSTEEFQNLMQLLRSNEGKLSFQTLAQLYTFLRSAWTLLINEGHTEFTPLLHEVNKDNLERGYFFVNGKITPHAYVNLVQVSTRAKDFTWAREFTKAYQGKIIGGDEGQLYYRFNMAHTFFTEGKFEEALAQIPDAPSTFHYHHMIRRLELKIYYELDSDLLFYKHDAFRKFIERTAPKTLAANLREMDVNFLNILLQLSQSLQNDKARSALLVKRIEEKKLLAERAWLLEKARALGEIF